MFAVYRCFGLVLVMCLGYPCITGVMYVAGGLLFTFGFRL